MEELFKTTQQIDSGSLGFEALNAQKVIFQKLFPVLGFYFVLIGTLLIVFFGTVCICIYLTYWVFLLYF
jgi:hypothetical protein